jgi:hypothetical protein
MAGCPSGQRERSVKPSAQPTLVRTQHLPPPAKTARTLRKRGPAGRFVLVASCLRACHDGSIRGNGKGHIDDSVRTERAAHLTARFADPRPFVPLLGRWTVRLIGIYAVHPASCSPPSCPRQAAGRPCSYSAAGAARRIGPRHLSGVPAYAAVRRSARRLSFHSGQQKAMARRSRSVPFSAYSAPGDLRQGPGCAA